MKHILISVFLVLLLASCSTSIRFSTESQSKSETKPFSVNSKTIDIGDYEGVYKKLVSEAQRWIGVPYKWGGQTMDGVDCSAFVGNVYKSVGISLPRTSTQQFESYSTNVEKPKVGDLMFFTFTNSQISHVGMYVGNDQFIHASSSKGVTLQHIKDRPYAQKLVGIKRIID